MSKILKSIKKRIQGFTLIELLAVMAIVAVLAGIVSVAVTGSGQTSRDAQVQEDANSTGSALTDFFDNQPITELFDTLEVTVTLKSSTFTDVTEKTSNKFPEIFITDLYGDVFHVTKKAGTTLSPTTTVNAIEFLDLDGGGLVATDTAVPANITANRDYSEWTVARGGLTVTLKSDATDQTLAIKGVTYYFELNTTTKIVKVTTVKFAAAGGTDVGEAHVFKVDDLLTDFNAVDWDSLDAGGFSTTIPESFKALATISDTVSYHQYLWLLEKDTEQGNLGTINSRNIAVFVLLEVVPTSTEFDLTFRRLT